MTLAGIYQVILEDVILMLAKKNSTMAEKDSTMAKKDSAKAAWETLQTMHVGVERAKEANVHTLKSEFKVVR